MYDDEYRTTNPYQYDGPAKNPYASAMLDADDLSRRIEMVANELADAMDNENVARQAAQYASDGYQSAEDEAILMAVYEAQAKEGPLAGIAVTSKAYDIALNKMRSDLRNGELAHLWSEAQRLQRAYDDAKMEKSKVEVLFGALRKASDLIANTLRCGARL